MSNQELIGVVSCLTGFAAVVSLIGFVLWKLVAAKLGSLRWLT
jgi:hypothetical protein